MNPDTLHMLKGTFSLDTAHMMVACNSLTLKAPVTTEVDDIFFFFFFFRENRS